MHVSALLVSCAAALVLACASSPTIGAPEGSPQQSKDAAAQKEAAVTKANVDAAAERQDREVDVDLSPHGMAASIRAPEHAQVIAHDDGVELRNGDDYHLFVGRGVLDVLGEKGEIVQAYGGDFVQFLEDRRGTVVWETKAVLGRRFHFFASHELEGAAWHCRTGEDGAPSLEIVRAMVDACRRVKIVDATTFDTRRNARAG